MLECINDNVAYSCKALNISALSYLKYRLLGSVKLRLRILTAVIRLFKDLISGIYKRPYPCFFLDYLAIALDIIR